MNNHMGLNYRSFTDLLGVCLVFLLISGLSYGDENDVLCLRFIKESLKDPNDILNPTWNFNNATKGFICSFTGIDCWAPGDDRVLNIRLSGMGLKGSFPLGIRNCSSLQHLDLSSNDLGGVIPADISSIIPYVTVLDLSSNRFSGEIPVNLANCSYLNSIQLGTNRFSGQIPSQLGQLSRLKTITVANNLLVGPIPSFGNSTTEVDFSNNPGLCGPPLSPCGSSSGNSRVTIIAVSIVVGVIVGVIVVGIVMFFARRLSVKNEEEEEDPEGNEWAKSIKGTNKIKVSMFEDSISRMRLSDLMKATNNFSKQNIIGEGRMGTIYKAKLEDGSFYMVKRLQDTQHSEAAFISEMTTLGTVKHRDLVPLLGFCLVGKEKLLVYKYMPHGTLYDKLRQREDGCAMNYWPTRLKVAIGAARGLAWLHHNCNPRILHRSISSKCILLDADFEPKISDFGLARLMNPLDTHLSTFVIEEFGDLGYVAPEYSRTLVATPKGDVYSFGVVLLELITGERPTQVTRAPESFKGNLVEWVAELSRKSYLKRAMEKSLLGKGVDHELTQFLKVALKCVSSDPKERPSMFEAYQLLRAIGEKYHFSADAEMMLPMVSEDDVDLRELIVSQEVQSEQ